MPTLTVDANVLVYAVDLDAGDRHEQAVVLMERVMRARAVLTLQTLAEFVHVATRKKGVSYSDVGRQIDAWRETLPVRAADPDCLDRALSASSRHGLAFWDAMLWATADKIGCETLLSEDFQDGRRLGRVQFVNPFDPANQRLVDSLLPPA